MFINFLCVCVAYIYHLGGSGTSFNSVASSIAVCQFAARGDMEWYVVVGTARDLTLTPRTCSGGSLILFRMTPDGTKLEHVHTVSAGGYSG